MLTKSFAFCCFAFVAPNADHLTMENRTGKYTIMDWAQDVQAALEVLPSVEDFILISEPSSTLGRQPDELLERWGFDTEFLQRMPYEYGQFVPHPSSGALKFTLRIPKAVRERLSPWDTIYSDTYEVRMDFRGVMPVCAIIGNDARDKAPVTVPLVREFLRDEFSHRSAQMRGIEFVYLPPAPMHMLGDVYEDEDAEPDAAPSLRVIPSPGYDMLEVRVATGQTDARLEELLGLLASEVAMYYRLVGTQHYFQDVERVLEAHSVTLVTAYRATGLRAYTRRVFGGYRAAANLQIMAVEAEQARKQAVAQARSARDDQIRLTADLILSKWIDQEINHLEETSAPEIERISAFVSSGTTHSVQTLAVIASAGLGGALGAALTALFT